MALDLTDTHTHLYEPEFDDDREQVLARAREAGVQRMLLPAIDPSSHERLFALCRSHPHSCFPMMGLHPTSVNANPAWRDHLALTGELLARPPVPRFHAVGEVGLDLYWSRAWEREQREAFATQIEWSLRYGLPLVIHTRDAWEEMIEMLESYRGRGLKGVMHAFSGTENHYLRIKACGRFLFGIGGPLTYKKSALATLLPRLPLDDLLLETDSPYLPPVPYRGRRNESAHLVEVCLRAAELLGLSAQEVARRTSANAAQLFSLPAPAR